MWCDMDKEEMKTRTKAFALRVLKVVKNLPTTTEGKVIAYQLAKSGTSVGANYRAACRARSNKEFIAKLGVVLEEADETAFWLELIMEGGILAAAKIKNLHQEADELCAVLFSSIRSTSEK